MSTRRPVRRSGRLISLPAILWEQVAPTLVFQRVCGPSFKFGPPVGGMIVAGDGNAYLSYAYSNVRVNSSGSNIEELSAGYFMLLRVSPDGSFAKIQLGTGTYDATNPVPLTGTGTTCTATGSFFWNGSGPTVITNAGTGAAVFATVYQYPGGDCSPSATPAYSLQISYVSQDSVTSQVNAAVNAFLPALQREDGSYIGTDGYMNLIALGLDGSVVWQQTMGTAPLTPLYATADGGAIVTSTTQCPRNIVTQNTCTPQLGTLYTVDQNGNVTSQTPDTGVVYSWTGQWYDPAPSGGTVSAVTMAAIDFARTLANVLWGNPSQNSVAGRSWYFKLAWQNDFNFIPANPSELTGLETPLSPAAVTAIRASALKALKDAYFADNPAQSGWPIIVSEGTAGTGDDWAVVVDHMSCPGAIGPYGCTDPDKVVSIAKTRPRVHESQVDYTNVMEDAQWALNVAISNQQDEATVLQQRQDLLVAIGRAIGNTAAHEIAHHFLVECCSMDVTTAVDPNARGTYNTGDSSPVSDPSFFTGFWPNTIISLHWEAPAFVGLNNWLNSDHGWQDAGPKGGSFCFTGWK